MSEFAVRAGSVISNSYQPCPKHQILSVNGLFQLGVELQACLLEELAKFSNQPS